MVALRLAEETAAYVAAPGLRLLLAEPAPEPLNEAELGWIWAGQRFPSEALRLADGRELRVLNPGRPGGGSGPDFLDAVLRIDGREVRGDVELHVRASGFRSHGHDSDSAYDGVALHVVFRADDGAETRLSNGCRAPVAELASWLEGRTEELRGWLTSAAVWQEPCGDALSRLGEAGVRAVLRAEGLQRFGSKTNALDALIGKIGERKAIWRSLFSVLGVGSDRGFFDRLAREVEARAVDRSTDKEIPNAWRHYEGETGAGIGDNKLLSELLAVAHAIGMPRGTARNRPERRLAGIAALYGRARGELPGFVVESVVSAERVKELVVRWQVAGRNGPALIGAGRARELALNLALPLAALRRESREKALSLLEQMPASPPYGKTAFLESNLRLPDGRRLVRTALEQQGLLSLLKGWCSQGGCGRCPLSPREG